MHTPLTSQEIQRGDALGGKFLERRPDADA
jgi:hypothetical protein